MILIYMILNIINYIFKMDPVLTSIWSFVNKSLTISIFDCSTAKTNGVLWNYIKILFNI